MTFRAAAALLLASGLILGLAGCTPEPGPLPTIAPSSESPKPVETVEPEPEPEPEGLTADDIENIRAVLDSGNTAALEGYLADEVNFIIAASECCGPMSALDAIDNMSYISAASGPWATTPQVAIDGYRTHFYVDYFPDDALVFSSSDEDPYVISFLVVGDKITQIFIASDYILLL